VIAIITDSTAGFAKKEALSSSLIVLPMTYSVSNREYKERYIDDVMEEPITLQNNKYGSTASANVRQYYRAFENLTRMGVDVVCITISSRLSSAYTNAVAAKHMINNGKIEVIDSKQTSGGLYLLVEKALELNKANLPFETLVEKIKQAREDIGLAFSVDDMGSLRKSGRIGLVSLSIGTFLNLRPILLLKDGTIVSHSVARGKSQIRQLVGCIPKDAKKVIVLCKDANPLKNELVSAVLAELKNVAVKSFTNVITVHINYNAIGVAWSRN